MEKEKKGFITRLKNILFYNKYRLELLELKDKGKITEKEFKKKLSKAFRDSIICTLAIIIIPVIIIFGGYTIVHNINEKRIETIERSKEVVLPNIIGKTMAEAEDELSKLELNVERCSDNYKDLDGSKPESIVQKITRDYSSIKEGDIVKKGDLIRIWGVSQEWKDEQQERKEETSLDNVETNKSYNYNYNSHTKNIIEEYSTSSGSSYSTRIINTVKKFDSSVNFDTEEFIGETIVYVTLIPRDSYTVNNYGKCSFQINKNTNQIIQVPSAFSMYE